MPALTEVPANRRITINLLAYRAFAQLQNGFWLAIREDDITTNPDAAPIYLINIDA